MGDNRPGSGDCRRFGCIPLEKIEGVVTIRFWPLNKFGKVESKDIIKVIKYKKVHICTAITLTKERELLTEIMDQLENGN